MNAFVLLGAIQVDELIKILVIILIFVVPAIGKLLSGMREQKRQAGPQRPVVPPQPQAQQQPQVQVARPKSVKDEIDEFLRRAAQKKQVQSASGAPARRISQPSPSLAQREEPVQAEMVRERPVGGEVSEHVKKYLDEKQFDQRAAKLGGDVASADNKFEQHLKQVFGHGISQLATRPGETASAPTPSSTGFFQDEVPVMAAAGTGLAVLLNNIDNLRQAIVLNEILQRPIDRWK